MKIGIDKRVYVRASFLCRVTLSPGAGATIEANSVDISLGGVGVISPRPVAAGSSLTLGFPLRDRAGNPVVERVSGRVAHVRSDIDGHFLGIEFLEPLDAKRNPLLVRRIEQI